MCIYIYYIVFKNHNHSGFTCQSANPKCYESNKKPAQMLLVVLTKGPHPHWVDQQPLEPEDSAKDSDEDGLSEIFLKHSGKFKDNDNRTKLE